MLDNCPFTFNPGQDDTDGDSVGNACEEDPRKALPLLITKVRSLGFPKGVETSLVGKLNAALDSVNKGLKATAVNQLRAFMREVNAQTNKKISQLFAQELLASAQQTIDNLQAP